VEEAAITIVFMQLGVIGTGRGWAEVAESEFKAPALGAGGGLVVQTVVEAGTSASVIDLGWWWLECGEVTCSSALARSRWLAVHGCYAMEEGLRLLPYEGLNMTWEPM
jgi:hypothetical protein